MCKVGKVYKVEKVRSTFHTFHDYLNFCGEKKDDRLFTIYLPLPFDASRSRHFLRGHAENNSNPLLGHSPRIIKL